jgi:chromosome partitioning protein
MLRWLKHKEIPAPEERPVESEHSTEERLERLLNRLGTNSSTANAAAVAAALHEIPPLQRADTRTAREPTGEALTEVDPIPRTDSKSEYAVGAVPDDYHEALPLLLKVMALVGVKPEEDSHATAARLIDALRDRYGFTTDLLSEINPYLEQFVHDIHAGVVRLDAEAEGAVSVGPVNAEEDAANAEEDAAEASGEILPSAESESVPAGQPVAEAVNEIEPVAPTDSRTAEDPAAEALKEVDPPPSTDNRADDRFALRRGDLTITHRGHGPSAAALLAKGYTFATGPDGKMVMIDADGHLVDTALPLSSTDGVAAKEPVAEALNEITPLPTTRRRTIRESAAEVLDEINPPPRTDRKAAGEPGQMYVIAVSSQKGGSGKTTIAAHLAVQAGAAGHGPVVLIDTDPQGSLAEWWHARTNDTPALATVKPEELATNLAELRSYGTAIAIIDTPPALTGSIEQVIAMADLVLIPVRPSPHDLRAAGGTVELVRRAEKPFLFVVNSASPRASITAQAVAALSEHGRVAPVILYQRTEYAASMIDGRTVTETAGSGRSAQEIAELWRCVYAQIGMRVAA